MSGYLLDTNVLSEVVKKRPSPVYWSACGQLAVINWPHR